MKSYAIGSYVGYLADWNCNFYVGKVVQADIQPKGGLVYRIQDAQHNITRTIPASYVVNQVSEMDVLQYIMEAG